MRHYQRRRIADANTNCDSDSYSHCYANSYSDRNWHTQAYAYAPGGTLTEASPDSATATVRPGHQ